MSSRELRIEGPLDAASLRTRRGVHAPLSVVALGTFDGVHKGHQVILREALARKEALQRDCVSDVEAAAFTFDKLPLERLRPDKAPARLLTTKARCEKIIACGMDRVVMAKFDDEFVQIEAEAFVKEILFGAFHIDTIVVGFNHSFGRHGRGNADILRHIATEHGVNVHVVGGVTDDADVISSTLIRRSLLDGQCEKAANLLGQPYFLEGTVVDGYKKGRGLGYPTANLQPFSRLLIPKDGVYLTRVEQGELCLGYALTVVSDRPTFHGEDRSIESYILEYAGNLYGAHLRLHFLEYLRPITRFAGPEQLVKQIEADVQTARQRVVERTQLDSQKTV